MHHHLERGAWDNESSKPMSNIPTVIRSSDQIKQILWRISALGSQRQGIPNGVQVCNLFMASSQPRSGISYVPTRSSRGNLQGTETAEVADPGATRRP